MASAGRRGHKGGTKRSKSYFRKCTSGKRSRWERKLDVGMKGVLITCNRDEKQCIREAYDLLTEYADELYGNEVDVGLSDGNTALDNPNENTNFAKNVSVYLARILLSLLYDAFLNAVEITKCCIPAIFTIDLSAINTSDSVNYYNS